MFSRAVGHGDGGNVSCVGRAGDQVRKRGATALNRHALWRRCPQMSNNAPGFLASRGSRQELSMPAGRFQP